MAVPPKPRTPSDEEKKKFLQYIEHGNDRATAAWLLDNPDYTGSLFRSMCNPESRNYDPDFARAYDQAVAARGPLDPTRFQVWSAERDSSPTTPTGYTKAMHLTDDQLDTFLDLVREGTQAWAAAKQLDPPTSMTQIHRRAAKDREFAAELREALDEGYGSYKDVLRAEATRQAMAGDYRALRDQLVMHVPEAKALTTNRHEVGGIDGAAIRLFAEQNLADLPKELLEEVIKSLEDGGEVGELGPGSG